MSRRFSSSSKSCPQLYSFSTKRKSSKNSSTIRNTTGSDYRNFNRINKAISTGENILETLDTLLNA